MSATRASQTNSATQPRTTQTSRPRPSTVTGASLAAVHALPANKLTPGALSADNILLLQRLAGNRAVTQLTAASQTNAPPAPPALKPAQASQPHPAAGQVGFEVDQEFEDHLNAEKSGGHTLPDNVRSEMEPRFGADFSGVRLHTGSAAVHLNRAVGALAFTHAQHIFLGADHSDVQTEADKHLLAHELTHVLQQTGGLAHPAAGPEISRFPSPRLMRYSAPTTNYEIGVATSTRQPFTRNDDETSVMPRKTIGAPGLGAGWQTHTPGKPPLYVADDGSLAINSQKGEPKEFYAAPAVLTQANERLETVKSPIRLGLGGNRITLQGATQPLEMVQPRKAQEEVPPGQDEFISLTTATCRDVAKYIIGYEFDFGKLGTKRITGLSASGPTVVTGLHEIAQSMVNNDTLENTERGLATGKEATMPKVGKAYGTALGKGTLDDKARTLGVNQFARANVGEAYTTQRIENQVESLRTDFSQDEHGGVTHDFTWGYHFAAVVAQSLAGDDQITLENYNRGGDQEHARELLLNRLEHDFAAELTDYIRDHPAPDLSINPGDLPTDPQQRDMARKLKENENDKLRQQRIGEILHWLDKRAMATKEEAARAYKAMSDERLAAGTTMWYFRMVGSQGGQSFHEQMASSNFFSNPLTLAVGGARAMGKLTLSFPKASHTLNSQSVTIVNGLAGNFLIDRKMGHTRTLRIVGYASGQGVGTARRKAENQRQTALARANAVRQQLEVSGVDTTHIVVQYGVPDPTWSDAAKRKATIEVV